MPAAAPHHDTLTAILAADGPLSSLLPGYAPRQAQQDMAHAILDAYATPTSRTVIEAGTGTGKSLAYLLPALIIGRRLVVATGTKALQDQLCDKDIPIAVAALKQVRGDKQVHVVRMKGRKNYLCKWRFEQRTSQQTLGMGGELVQISRFARTTKTGDKAELTGLREDLPLWHEVDADADTCLGSSCPVYDECFVVEMKRAAAEAHIVVANHHLLCADQRVRLDSSESQGQGIAQVLPLFDMLVIDEAHQLPDVATGYFGIQVSQDGLQRLSGDARRLADKLSGDGRAFVLDQALALDDDIRAFVGACREAAPRQRGARDGKEERSLLVVSAELQEAEKLITGRLTAIADVLKGLADETRVISGTQPVVDAEREALVRRAERLRAELSYVLAVAQNDPTFVVFVDASARQVAITAAPIDVGTPINGTLLQLSAPIVFTSATLTIGGSSRHFQLRVGLEVDVKEGDTIPDAPAMLVETQVFASPFRFDERAALYVPTGAPEQNDAASASWYFDELEFLADLSGGGMMALFTSRRAMDEAYERMSPILTAKGIPCARQGDRPRGALLDELRQHPTGAALFATHSFWEGVDVAGRALRMVVIDRLPFRVPTDPLVRARADMAKARGLDPFRDIAVPEAALALKQGVGRLLRTVNDAGVVAVLDGRLRQKTYGKVFLDALPPMMRVGSRRVLSQFWARRVAPVLGLPVTHAVEGES